MFIKYLHHCTYAFNTGQDEYQPCPPVIRCAPLQRSSGESVRYGRNGARKPRLIPFCCGYSFLKKWHNNCNLTPYRFQPCCLNQYIMALQNIFRVLPGWDRNNLHIIPKSIIFYPGYDNILCFADNFQANLSILLRWFLQGEPYKVYSWMEKQVPILTLFD